MTRSERLPPTLSPTADFFSKVQTLADTTSPASPTFNAKSKSLARDLHTRVTQAQFDAVLRVLNELARQLDIAIAEAEEALRARKGKSRALDQAGDRRTARGRHAGPSSIAGEPASPTSAPDRSSESMAAAISTEGFMSSAEMQQRLGVKRQALSVAVKSGRLFAIVGPSGDNFYPSYYADPSLDRGFLRRCQRHWGRCPQPPSIASSRRIPRRFAAARCKRCVTVGSPMSWLLRRRLCRADVDEPRFGATHHRES